MSSAAVSAYSARSRASDRYAHQQSRVVTIYDNFYRYKNELDINKKNQESCQMLAICPSVI